MEPLASSGRGTGGLAALLAAALLAAALLAVPAGATRAQVGNVIVSLNGGFSPHLLPRDRPAPVSVTLGGTIRTADGSPLPRVERIELAMASSGLLFTRGLPLCSRAKLRTADDRQAMQRCGPSLVGRGRLDTEVFVPGQAPFEIHAGLLAFNGRTRGGAVVVWVHAFSTSPPVSLVLPFEVHRRPGPFGTVLVARVRRSVGPWPHLARFEMTFGRRFAYRWRRRSYLRASCPVPPRFTGGLLPFASATYSFAAGPTVTATLVRACHVR